MPKVRLVNKDVINKELELAGWMASVSTATDNTNYTKIAENCIDSRHGTPTRAMRFIFEIEGVSRAFSHEFVRHEIGTGKVQRSQRYVNEDRFQYVKPAGLENKTIVLTVPGTDGHIISLDYDQFQDLVAQMYNGYIFLGAKAEDARYVLTNGTFTKLHVSFDWEALKNFCERRCCSRTQWEIRDIANLMRDEVSDVNEFLGKRLGAYCETHGYCPEVKGCGKAMSLATMKEYAWRYDTIKDKYI